MAVMTSSPARHSMLLAPEPNEPLDSSEEARARWERFTLELAGLSDAAAFAACAPWANEPAPQRLRYLAALRCCWPERFKPMTLKALAGPWEPADPASALHPFHRAFLAVFILQSDLANEKNDDDDDDEAISVFISAEQTRSKQTTDPAARRAEALLFLLQGASFDEINAPWPALDGERLLPALFGSLKKARWAVETLGRLNLDFSNEGHGPGAASLLIQEAARDSSRRHATELTPWIEAAQAQGRPLWKSAPGERPPLHLAVEQHLARQLQWEWPEALIKAGANINAPDAQGRSAAHLAFETPNCDQERRQEAWSGLFSLPRFDWSARSVWGRAPRHSARLSGAEALEWWALAKDTEALWDGTTASDAIAFITEGWNEESRSDIEALIDWMDARFSTLLAVRTLGLEPPEGWVESAFERGFSRWLADLPSERSETIGALIKARAQKAKALVAALPDARPAFELYTPESWKEFAAEYIGGPGETHAFAQKLNKRVKTLGEGHRVRRLALASALLESLDELRMDFPHFSEVIDHLDDHCHLQMAGDGSFFIPPMLLAGGPGVGKTFFFKRVADYVSTAYKVLHMESMTGSFVITGMASSWSDSRPGSVYSALELGETSNPIILLDEIDKSSQDSKHRPDTALLPLLEPHSAASFQDECVPLKLDARRVCWVATANDLSTVTAPLKSRMDVFRVRAPNARERRALCSGVYRAVLSSGSWGAKMSPTLSEAVLDMAAQTQGPGATRDLRRALTTACAKALRAGRSEILPTDLPCAARPAPTLWDAALPEPDAARAA